MTRAETGTVQNWENTGKRERERESLIKPPENMMASGNQFRRVSTHLILCLSTFLPTGSRRPQPTPAVPSRPQLSLAVPSHPQPSQAVPSHRQPSLDFPRRPQPLPAVSTEAAGNYWCPQAPVGGAEERRRVKTSLCLCKRRKSMREKIQLHSLY